MEISVASVVATCSVCGEPLNRKGECLACLLRVALDKSDVESAAPVSLVFGDFEIARREDGSMWELGRGAMGVTYLAVDKVLRRKVAVKVIDVPASPTRRESRAVRERFLREARAAGALRHSNVAAVFQFGAAPDGSRCFYAMELVEGETLEARVRRDGPLKPKLVVEIATQVAQALIAAAAQGLVHRDLKPGNIMLKPGNGATELEVKVIDFGLAKAVADAESEMDITHGEFVGTPNFASPEQFESGPVDVRSDIYSLGATLWFALTGKPPFAGYGIDETRRAQKSNMLPVEQLKAARVPSRLRSLVTSMLAREPAARPGTQELAARLRRCSAQASGARRNRVVLATALILIIGTSAFYISHLWQTGHRPVATQEYPTSTLAPEKSIAVLPFENLSTDKEDASFADGVQDDILTKLARIADLKVISRTSVMQYRDQHNTRDIGNALGVSHVLEGSVRKTGAWLHINAQLIDARTDTHVWVEQYDRDLKDMFAIQSEIAQKIAERLHAKISAAERLAIERPPTADLTAFDFYNRSKTFLLTVINGSNTNTGEEDLLRAADSLNQAVAHDPTFFQAYCQLAWTHDYLYFHGFDRSPARLSLADAALQAAFRLRPDAAEAHLARAWNLYWGYRDYGGALAELDIAGKALPNDARLFELRGYIERRRPGGSQEEALRSLERAIELDPRNVHLLTQTSASYEYLRRYQDDETILDRALAVDPNNLDARVSRAFVEFDWKADTRPLHQLIDKLRVKDPAAIESLADSWLLCALAERDPTSIADAIAALGENNIGNETIKFHPRFVKGLIARMANDDVKARAAFTAARAEQEKLVRARPDDAGALCVLGLIDAGLARKEEALREGRRAVELLPVERDAIGGRRMIEYLAVIAAWVGDKYLACEQLGVANRVPAPVTYGELRLLPFWDPLRGDPCFEQIVASLAGPAANPVLQEKSIAVLPFENLSNDREDASFADGVQDDILTKLANIADLNVISHTSVMQYRAQQDAHQIGDALRVSHVLEGSVRKTGAWLHINAQLIDARTDTHVWAEEYDCDLKDMFAIQSAIAQKVARQLHAKISPAEKLAIEHAPTASLTAFDLYSRAKNLILVWNYTPNERGNLLQAADLLNQAVTHDPKFFQAYCQLAWVHDQLYFFGHDHTSARLALADAAIQAAFQLRPNAGEAHLARAGHLYRANLNYDGALAELETARETLPNDARLFQLKGSIERRRPGGNQKEALRNFERATDLDPRNVFILAQTALSYDVLRRYADEETLLDRLLAIQPKDVDTKVSRALVELDWKANTRPLHQVMDEIHAKEPDAIQSVADTWLVCALAERDAAAAAGALTALGKNRFGYATLRFGPHFVEGLIARMTKDDAKAQSAFAAARAEQEKIVEGQPNYGPALCVLGLIDAALGAKDQALREGRRAVELLSVEKDGIDGPRMITYFAIIAAWVGDKDLACEQLAIAVRFPSSPSYGELKLLPFWDPLRGEPRFEQIVASLAPNES